MKQTNEISRTRIAELAAAMIPLGPPQPNALICLSHHARQFTLPPAAWTSNH
jgi:hypothetical protein